MLQYAITDTLEAKERNLKISAAKKKIQRKSEQILEPKE